jgi:hypothetical protein
MSLISPISTPARRGTNPYWLLVFGAVLPAIQLGSFSLRNAPLTPLDLWYQPTQVLWIVVLINLGAFAVLFRQVRRAAQRAAADPDWAAQERAQAHDLLIPRRGRMGALVFLWPFLLVALLSMGVFLVLVISILESGMDSGFVFSVLQAIVLLPIGILIVGIGSYWLRIRSATYVPPAPLTQNQIKTRLVTQTVALVGSLLCVGPFIFLLQSLDARPTAGPAASWAVQRDFVQMLAARIDPEAVLDSISAAPTGYKLPLSAADTVFEVDFVFMRPDGHSLRLEIADTDPPRLLRADRDWDTRTPAPSAEELARARAVLALIQRSPREVYLATLPLVQAAQPGGDPPHPSVSLFADHDWQAKYGVLTVWNMDYYLNPKSLLLRVHPQTGAVLAQEQR